LRGTTRRHRPDEFKREALAAALVRLAAVTVGRTETALGAFYRRLSARIDKAKAVTATARKIAVLIYNTLRHGMDYASFARMGSSSANTGDASAAIYDSWHYVAGADARARCLEKRRAVQRLRSSFSYGENPP
jgi:hypothetical protein